MSKKFLTMAAGAFFLSSAMVAAQSAPPGQAPASDQNSVQTGTQTSAGAAKSVKNGSPVSRATTVNAELNSSIDAKKAKPGDVVTAHTTEAIKSADGKIVLPKGAKLVGHVTQASARAKDEGDSSLGVTFDKATVKGSGDVQLNMAILAIAAPPADAAAMNGINDMDPMGTPVGNSGPTRGTMGSTNPNTDTVVGTAANTASNTVPGTSRADAAVDAATGAAANTRNGAAGMPNGLNAAGQLTSNSRGVFGLKDITLSSNATQGTLITSSKKNVKLDSGTRLLLAAQAVTSAPSGR